MENVSLSLKRRELYANSNGSKKNLNQVLEWKTATKCTKNVEYNLKDETRSTFVIAFSPDRAKVATSHGTHTILISDCLTLNVTYRLSGHIRTPWCVTFHPRIPTILASGCLGGQVRLWNLNNITEENVIYSTHSVIASLTFHPVNDILVIATLNQIIYCDWNKKKIIKVLKTKSRTETVRFVKFSPDGGSLITGTLNLSSTNYQSTAVNVTTRGSDNSSGEPIVQTVSCMKINKRKNHQDTSNGQDKGNEKLPKNRVFASNNKKSSQSCSNYNNTEHVNLLDEDASSFTSQSSSYVDPNFMGNKKFKSSKKNGESHSSPNSSKCCCNSGESSSRLEKFYISRDRRLHRHHFCSKSLPSRHSNEASSNDIPYENVKTDKETQEGDNCKTLFSRQCVSQQSSFNDFQNNRTTNNYENNSANNDVENKTTLKDVQNKSDLGNANIDTLIPYSSQFENANEASTMQPQIKVTDNLSKVEVIDGHSTNDSKVGSTDQSIIRKHHSGVADEPLVHQSQDGVTYEDSVNNSQMDIKHINCTQNDKDVTNLSQSKSNEHEYNGIESENESEDQVTSVQNVLLRYGGDLNTRRLPRSEIWNFTLGNDEPTVSSGADGDTSSEAAGRYVIEGSSSTIPVHGFVSFAPSPNHSVDISNIASSANPTAVATATARSSYHVHTAVVIASQNDDDSERALQTAVNRAIAGAFAGSGEAGVANNIVDTTHRLQLWDSNDLKFPDLTQRNKNLIVERCKIHNDSNISLSQDGSLIAVFVPSFHGFPMDAQLQVISLKKKNFLQCIYSRKYGPNAVCANISPLNQFLVVGLASRRLHWQLTSQQLIGQVLKLPKEPDTKLLDDSKATQNILHKCSKSSRSNVSVNAVCFHPTPGMGIIYGTNRGHLQHCQI